MLRSLLRKLSRSVIYLILPIPLFIFFLSNSLPAQAAGPESCHLGAYLADLHNLDTNNKSFNADIWLWSTCPHKGYEPLQSVEYVNADTTTTSLYSLTQKDKLYWSSIKVTGTFRYNWDVQYYPFDKHTLEIVLEEGNADATALTYVPDAINSGYNPNIHIEGWNITNFRVVTTQDHYTSNFGDPSHAAGKGSVYSQAKIQITLARSDYTNFFQLMAPVYFAFAIALVTFFLATETSSSLGLLAGVLFVVVVNLRNVASALGSDAGITLVDLIHIVTLFYILVAVIISIISRQMPAHGHSTKKIVRMNLFCFWASLISFTLLNVILIFMAAKAG